MVGFGEEANAKQWVQDNSERYPFAFFLDPEQKLYREMGVKRSVARVWDMRFLVYLAEKQVAGTLVLEHFEGDDLHFLAGDYLSDSLGKLLLAYGGAYANDRPSVGEILAALDSAAA